MVVQYPHFLFTQEVSSIQDTNGNWIQSIDNPIMILVCRNETNGKGNTINGIDGKAFIYSSIIYLPLSSPDFEVGTEISIYEQNSTDSNLILKMPIVQFSKGQLNKRIWV